MLHMGDDVLSEEKGSESLRICTGNLPDYLSEIVVILSCFGAGKEEKGLDMLKSICLTVTDAKDGAALGSFQIGPEEVRGQAAALLSLERKEDGWHLCKKLRPLNSWRILDQARKYGLEKWKE